MRLDLAADSSVFVDDFGESVRFRASSSSTARTLTAVVLRSPADDDSDSPFSGTRQQPTRIRLRNDTGKGVKPEQITIDESQIEVAADVGEFKRWRNITRIVQQDAGMVLVEVMS